MERCGLDAARHGPVHGALKHIGAVCIEAEDEASVHHHAEFVATPNGVVIASRKVLSLCMKEVLWIEGFEADKHTAHACLCGTFDQVSLQDRGDGACALENATHAAHAVEEGGGEATVPEEVVVEEIEMPPGSRSTSASASSTARV